MQAIILVGGRGTRLGDLTKKTPKPMLLIRGVPFLVRLLEHLKLSGFTKFVLATGYKTEFIENFFSSNNSFNTEIEISIEDNPLGTGGAILKALPKVNDENVFIFNGDTFFNIDYKALMNFHQSKKSSITIASKFSGTKNRYGNINIDNDNKVCAFGNEKNTNKGLFNGGIYYINVDQTMKILMSINSKSFSFERQILTEMVSDYQIYSCIFHDYFIDIGIPEDFQKAQKLLFI